MRILFVKPLLNTTPMPFGSASLEFPLGLMYLTAFIKKHGFKDVRIVHMEAERVGFDELARMLQEHRPDIIGISALTAESLGMFRVAKIAKKYKNDCLVIAGGPHPSGDPKGTLNDNNIDLVVCGEGEQALLNILQAYEHGTEYALIKNVWARVNSQIVSPAKVSFLQDIDALPYPDWDAVKLEKYTLSQPMSLYLHAQKYMALFTSRGCPFQCIFCHDIFGKRFRAHSPERVFDEISLLHYKYGIDQFEILDDVFNFDRDRVVQIMKKIIGSGMRIKLYFCNGLRGDMLDKELIDLFVEAGVVSIGVAIDTASPRLQKEIRKNINFDKIKLVIEYASRKNLVVNGAFMIGFPTETLSEVIQTIRYAVLSRLDSAGFYLVQPFAGTDLSKMAYDFGRPVVLPMSNQRPFQYVSRGSANCSNFKNWQLGLIFGVANFLFYCNPFRLIKILKFVPNKKIMRLFISQYISRVFQVK